MSAALAVAAAVAVLCALGGARPHDEVPRMELGDVVGRTLCPLRVLTDDDPLRVPRRIKFLTCDREALARCGPSAEPTCCGWPGAGCVEVYDSVLVQYVAREGADPAGAPRHVVQVPVGCACVLRAGTPAQPAD